MIPSLSLHEGQFLFYKEALPEEKATELMDLLTRTIEWEDKQITIQGRTWPVPRRTAWHGTKPYMYSGILNPPKPWTPELLQLKELSEKLCGEPVEFNGVLLNLYRHNRDSLSWHSDDEAEIGPAPVIASMSLGGPRRFCVRPTRLAPAGSKPFEMLMTNGSLLIMKGNSQRHWQHHVPKETSPRQPRINLTFRKMLK